MYTSSPYSLDFSSLMGTPLLINSIQIQSSPEFFKTPKIKEKSSMQVTKSPFISALGHDISIEGIMEQYQQIRKTQSASMEK